MPPPIPDRWIPYKACGKVIEGTRIICFKVPLRKAVQVNRSEVKEIWDIKTLLETIPNLGAVIDLTNTSRYYDSRELVTAGILHRKILMPGRIIPPEDKVLEFMDTVDEFLGKDCEFLVGVHCTHGLNRTGYMVCRYMRDRLNFSPKTAIKRFEKARGYKIERDNYIADILGETPPPADLDFGKPTKVKPLEDDKRKSYQENNNSRNKPRSSNWRSRENGESSQRGDNNSHWRSKRSDSEKSYDYKYDY